MNRATMIKSINQYQSVNVGVVSSEATPHKLVLMLLDGALEKLVKAKAAINRNDLAAKGEYIGWAISIIGGLHESLDFDQGGEIAVNLNDLYGYMQFRLAKANQLNDVAGIVEVRALLLEIKKGWDGINVEEY